MLSSNNDSMRDIQKLESIGKKGKVKKAIEISVIHLNSVKYFYSLFIHFRNNTHEFSLKIIGYVIKGIFLILRRSYETYHKELQSFIEIYINGNKKKLSKENENGDKGCLGNFKEKGSLLSLKNFSLLSENSSFENFLNDQKNSTSSHKKDYYKREEKILTEKKIDLSKYSHTRTNKSLNQNFQEDQIENFDDLNILNDRESLDLNFVYSKDLFSNFLNFNLEEIEKESKDSTEKEKLESKLFSEKIDKKNLFEELNTDKNPQNEFPSKFENDKIIFEKEKEKFQILFQDKKYKTKTKNFSHDSNNSQIDIRTVIHQSLLETQNFKKTNIKLYNEHCNKLILKEEIEKFLDTFILLDNNLNTMSLTTLKDIFHKNFSDEVISNTLEETNENENAEDEKEANNFPETAEKFRFEKEFSTSKIRKSIESSSILSNLSLQDVFNSTNKKLLDKYSHVFQEPNVNIILEEDSNFNLNTFNLKTNFNNLEFEYANVDNHQMQFGDDAGENRRSGLKLEDIQEEIANFVKSKSNKRKSMRKNFFSVEDLNSKVKSNLGKNKFDATDRELSGVIFYQLLIQAQNHKWGIYQDKPFEILYTY